jgi:hypothetical protein
MTESLALVLPALVRKRWLRIGGDWAKLAGAQAETGPAFTKPRSRGPSKSSD